MNYYKYEKNRVGKGPYGLIAIGVFIYFLSQNTLIANYHQPYINRASTPEPKYFIFLTGYFFISSILLGIYLGSRLFTITEQGKAVLLVPKYKSVPIEHSKLYRIKFFLMGKISLIYLISCWAAYYIALLLVKKVVKFDFFSNFIELWLGILILLVIDIIILLVYYVSEKISQKR